jgi:hypothetical protein
MKTEVNENKYGLNITLEPETVDEFASLLRFAKNSNSDKPQIYLSFQNEPYCDIWLKKRKESVQKNSISPQTK